MYTQIPQWWLDDRQHGKWLFAFAPVDADLPRIADALIQAVQAGAIGREPFTANMLAKATGLLHKQVTKALPYLEGVLVDICVPNTNHAVLYSLISLPCVENLTLRFDTDLKQFEDFPRLFVSLRSQGKPLILSPKNYRIARLERHLAFIGEEKRISYAQIAKLFKVHKHTAMRMVKELKALGKVISSRDAIRVEVIHPSRDVILDSIRRNQRKYSGIAFFALAFLPNGEKKMFKLSNGDEKRKLLDESEKFDMVIIGISPANRYTVIQPIAPKTQISKELMRTLAMLESAKKLFGVKTKGDTDHA